MPFVLVFFFSVLKLPGQGVQIKYTLECIKDFSVLLSDYKLPKKYSSLSFPQTVYTTLSKYTQNVTSVLVWINLSSLSFSLFPIITFFIPSCIPCHV